MIKIVHFQKDWGTREDCIVLRSVEDNHIQIAFPFHEDTPNFILSQSEGYSLQKALEEIVAVKFFEK